MTTLFALYDGCYSKNCEIEAEGPTVNLVNAIPTEDSYQEWLEELEWLFLDETCFCPVCRLELHD